MSFKINPNKQRDILLSATQMTALFVKSLRATERVRDSIANYVEKKLFLKVNKEKTEIGTLAGKKFLGYSFY